MNQPSKAELNHENSQHHPRKHDLKLPEEKINTMTVRMAFFYRLMSGCGTLAFAWATVVLLGGYSTLIKQRDFWFVTVIVFMEATWLFNNAKPEDQFFLRIPETMIKPEKFADALVNGSWQRHASPVESLGDQIMTVYKLKGGCISGRCCLAVLFSSVLGQLQLAALIGCTVMSSLRLKRQDYVDQHNQGNDDHKNIRWSLNIFYALVLSQCILCFLTGILGIKGNPIERVCLKYKLGFWGSLALSRYQQACLLKCINGDLREAVSMDLVSFAKQLLNSDPLDDQLLGIRILDHLLRSREHEDEGYKQNVLIKIRSSLDTIQRAVYMMGLDSEVEQETRGHAARILLELAPGLQVESFPGIFQSISSLLSVSARKAKTSGSSSNSTCASKELKLLGVDILDKLLTNPENCAEVKNAKNLLSKIIHITSCQDEHLVSDIDVKIVENSLEVLRKLVSTAGETGEELRCQVSNNMHTIRNISKLFIDHPESQPKMLAQALDILACLASNDTARKEIERSRLIIRKLISLLDEEIDDVQESISLLDEEIDDVQESISLLDEEIDDVQESIVRVSAAEALVFLTVPTKENGMLSTVSERSIKRVLSETKLEGMQRIVSLLFDESAEHRIMVAKFLQNLRSYQGAEYGDQLEIINKALPKVLEAIQIASDKIEGIGCADEPSGHEMVALITEQGKLLESFIGLCLQICISGNAKQFTDALRSAWITDDMFVQMLTKVLELYKSPTSDAPGIRRVVIQQMNWMMNEDQEYINIFLKHEMENALKKVAETAFKLENYWFFRFGIKAFEHEESIYSLLSISPLLQAGGSGL